MPGVLYLVGTPIGNLGDITLRALETLKGVDLIAAEDTRETRKLLTHFAIAKPLVSYHAHNERGEGTRLIQRLVAGESIALVSDAGMPGISDPGEQLVKQAVAAGITVVPIPGPTAFVTALVASGLPAGRFAFEGFLPREPKGRRRILRTLLAESRTLVFYEAPHRLLETLVDMATLWGGDRRAAVGRELTKLFETMHRDTLDGLVAHFTATAPRGEIVLIVEGASEKNVAGNDEAVPGAWQDELAAALAAGAKPADAAKAIAKAHGLPRYLVYEAAVTNKSSVPRP